MSNFFAKYLGWIGNAFLIAGAILIGEKTPYAFLFVFTGEALWSYRTFRLKAWDMFLICVIFGLLALRNFLLWTH